MFEPAFAQQNTRRIHVKIPDGCRFHTISSCVGAVNSMANQRIHYFFYLLFFLLYFVCKRFAFVRHSGCILLQAAHGRIPRSICTNASKGIRIFASPANNRRARAINIVPTGSQLCVPDKLDSPSVQSKWRYGPHLLSIEWNFYLDAGLSVQLSLEKYSTVATESIWFC